MKSYNAVLLAVVLSAGFFALPDFAQELPGGKEQQTFKRLCTTCHSIEITVRLRNTRNGWTEIVRAMRNNGAEGTETEFSEIIDYLTVKFGKKDDGPATKANSASAQREIGLRPVPWEKNRLKIGQAIYRENCVVCHDVDVEKSSKLGPSFYHLFQRAKMPDSGTKPDRRYIAGKVRVGGPLMPAFAEKLTQAEIDALLDYIQSK